MIRYKADRAALLAAIAAIEHGWPDKAARRTAGFVKAGTYAEKSSIWSTAKPVYMRVQMRKCIFCERQFENEQYGKIEFDVEHFRPKSSIAAWPDAQRHPNLVYDFATGADAVTGYYWLAYDVENYAASCKVCNTALKSNYFPIAGRRGTATADCRALADEQPFLCYPLGMVDDDPEDLVTFDITTAIPKAVSGHARRRGQIIIEFFDLNGREQLHRQRAQMISIFGSALAALTAGTASATDRKVAVGMANPALPHAACVRAFRRLWDGDPRAAALVYEKCREYVIDHTAAAAPEL